MKSLCLAVIFVFSAALIRAEEDLSLNTIWTSMSQVEGTLLWRSDISTSSAGSDEIITNCIIGFMREDGEKESFVSVLRLPILKNDNYVTAVTDGVLKITIKGSGQMVLNLDLRNFQPMALAR